jgi:hypothetical protein
LSTGDLIAYLARLGLQRLDPASRKSRTKSASSSAQNESTRQTNPATPNPEARRPPQQLIREVWQRDGGRCVWKNPETGRDCGSRFRVQLDHKLPWARGGEHSLFNLRCLCSTHNRLEAIKWFGKKAIVKSMTKDRD